MGFSLSSFVDNAVGAVGDVGQGVIDGVVDAGKSLDQIVRDTIPGGWVTVGLVAGGYSLMNAADAAAAEAAGTGSTIAAAEAATDPTISAIQNYLSANPGLSAQEIAQAANQYGITAEQVAQATGVPVSAVESAFSGTGLGATTAGNLAEMGGAQGLQSGITTSNLAGMGGAQGLTTAGTGLTAGALGAGGTAISSLANGLSPALTSALGAGAGAALGAGGAGTTANTLAGNLGTSAAAAGTGSLLGNAAAGAGGSTIGSLLTPTNVLGASALANTLTGLNTSNAIGNAMQTQQNAANQSRTDLGNIAQYVQGVQAPYQAAGVEALNQLGANKDYLTHQFNASDLASGLAPNYNFMLEQGQMANQRAANALGGGFGGNALQGLNKYTQDYAGNAYQNAFQNYQTQRNNIYNTLAGIAGLGQTSTGQLTNAAGTYGTNLTNLNVGNAAAQAAGQVAQAQQTGNTISGLGNTAFLASLLGQKGAVTP